MVCPKDEGEFRPIPRPNPSRRLLNGRSISGLIGVHDNTTGNRRNPDPRLWVCLPINPVWSHPGLDDRLERLLDVFYDRGLELASRVSDDGDVVATIDNRKVAAEAATRTPVRSQVLYVAAERDLLRLKRIAKAERSSPGDAQDIAFLEARHKRSKSK